MDLWRYAELLAGILAESNSGIPGILEELFVESDQIEKVMGRDHDVHDRQEVALFTFLDRFQVLPGSLLVGDQGHPIAAAPNQIQHPFNLSNTIIHDKDTFRFAHDFLLLLAPIEALGRVVLQAINDVRAHR